jgi:hypothetical protein
MFFALLIGSFLITVIAVPAGNFRDHFSYLILILILKQHNIYLSVNVTCSATAKLENPSAPPFNHPDRVHFNCNTLGV